MALLGLRRGDITLHGINNGEQFGLRWHRLFFPFDGMPAVHVGPATALPATPGEDAHTGLTAPPTLPMPVDADSSGPGDQDLGGPGPNSTDGVPAPQIEDATIPLVDRALDTVWHPPYTALMPLTDAPTDPVPAPDSAPPAGHIPKADAVIWSGPAIMAFPADPHETSGDAAAPGGAGDTADVADTPDVADAPDALTRADLDPVLTAMGSGADHAATSDTSGGDLSAAFLPPDSGDLADLPHGLDLGFSFTPPPLPPPPDMI